MDTRPMMAHLFHTFYLSHLFFKEFFIPITWKSDFLNAEKTSTWSVLLVQLPFANTTDSMMKNSNSMKRVTLYRGRSREGRGCTRHAPPPKIGKKKKNCVKLWFFHTKYQNIFVPRSARRDYFKCAPPTWNARSAPGLSWISYATLF